MRQSLERAVNALRYAPWLARERLLRWGAAGAFVTVGIFALSIIAHDLPGLTDATGEPLGRDFMGFWSNAQLAAAGRPEAAYVVGPHRIVDEATPYPPIVLMLCRPLAALSYPHALLIWGAIGLGLAVWTLSRLVGWEIAILAAVGTPAGLINIFLQQNGFYTAALFAWGMMLVERRPAAAGILLGMLCYKPQFGILLPIALVAGRHWRVFIAAALTVLALTAASVFLFGPQPWVGFFGRLPLQREFMETRVAALAWMSGAYVMMRLAGAGSQAAYFVQALSTLAAAAAVVVLWRSANSLAIRAAGLVVATFLATPYAWDYDMIILLFAAAWLAEDAGRTGFAPWEKITIVVLLTLPALSLVSAKLIHFQAAPVLLWLTMAVLLRRGLGRRFLPATARVGLAS